MATPVQTVSYLPFEKSIQKIDLQIQKMEDLSVAHAVDVTDEVDGLRKKRDKILRETYAKISPWETVLIARHPQRPQTRDYIHLICDEFIELHGDRSFSDDKAIVTGLATIEGQRFMLVGQHKGRDVHERAKCNFGYPHPEGYRKTLHKMKLAEKFGIPVVCLIDTPGAAAAVEAEERGISESIATNLLEMSGLKVPIACFVVGEGGSGGALAIGVGDVFFLQEYAYFSVITPEGCASILWRDPEKKEEAAQALNLTGRALMKFGIVDSLVPEPLGGAHRDPNSAADLLKTAILDQLEILSKTPVSQLLQKRYEKLRSIGQFHTNGK